LLEDLVARRRGAARSDRAGIVEAPLQGADVLAGEVHRPEVDLGEFALGVAQEAVGEGCFDGGAGGREGGDGVADVAPVVVGAEDQLFVGEGLVGHPDRGAVAHVVGEGRVAAGDLGHVHRLAGGEVEDPRARGEQERRAELLLAGRGLVAQVGRQDAQARDGRPVHPIAEGGQRPEV